MTLKQAIETMIKEHNYEWDSKCVFSESGVKCTLKRLSEYAENVNPYRDWRITIIHNQYAICEIDTYGLSKEDGIYYMGEYIFETRSNNDQKNIIRKG